MAPLHPLLSVRGRQGSLTSRASLVLATDLEEPLPETPPRRTKSQQAMLNSTRLRYLPAWRVVSLYLFLGFAVLTLLGLASMHAWHPKRQGSQPDNTSYGLLHQAALDEALTQMDVLGLALKPSCVNRLAITNLNKYLRPRAIHVVTTSEAVKCDTFRGFAPNVVCHRQDDLVPGVSSAAVAAHLARRFGVVAGVNAYNATLGRDVVGWYTQQFVKLGAVTSPRLRSLSRWFLIWDLDMIMLQPPRLLQPEPSSPVWHQQADGQQLKLDLGSLLPGRDVRAVVAVGGNVLPGYADTYQRLFNKTWETAPDNTSFVTHHMLVYAPYMRELLDQLTGDKRAAVTASGAGTSTVTDRWRRSLISRRGGGRGGDRSAATAVGLLRGHPPLAPWASRILSQVDAGQLELGFSEYATYISWVRQRHPQAQALAPQRTWRRHPLLGRTMGIALSRHVTGGICCPSPLLLTPTRWLGYSFTGYEVAHVPQCDYDAPQNALSYGLGYYWL